MLKLTATDTFVIAAEGESPRTISGVAVPWDTEATVSDGTRVKFAKGSLPVNGKKPKLLKYHDDTQPVGIVTSRLNSDQGMLFTARISATSEGNDMLELIKDEAIDAVSVGVNPIEFTYDDSGTMVITRGEWVELSLVTAPAFRGATITEVAATEGKPEEQELQPMTEKIETAAAVAEVPAAAPSAPLFAQAKKEFKLPSASEYISKLLKGGSEAQQFIANIRAAAPDVVTNDVPGILPEPIVGPVYNNFRGLRPVIDAIGVKAMPAGGQVFRRPVVTTHTTIGPSNGQNNALDQGTFVVSNENVTKEVYGGYVQLSEEAADWTQPEVISLLLDDMARIYANETDAAAATELASESSANTENFTVASIADPVEWLRWSYEAAQNILADSNGWLPTHLFLSPSRWAALGQLADTADRPLFPQVGPMNAYGNVQPGAQVGNAFGFTIVVDRNFTDEMILGHPDGFEIFEQQKGAIQVEASDGSLSRYIKFRGYLATLMVDVKKFKRAAFV